MRENRPLAFGGVLVFGSGFCLVFLFGFLGLLVFFSSHHVVFPSPSMMTWALRPHGVRTRGKKAKATPFRREITLFSTVPVCLGGSIMFNLRACSS